MVLFFSLNEMLEYKISSVIEVDIFRHGLLLYIYYCDKHLLRHIEHIITCLETLYFQHETLHYQFLLLMVCHLLAQSEFICFDLVRSFCSCIKIQMGCRLLSINLRNDDTIMTSCVSC
jgi:hypothetical protein